MAADLKDLRKAPVAEPYDGPALLSGRAAAVFFHEVLGHRLEGHRQRDEEEGQTFTKKIGQEVLPKFLSAVDDPTIHEMGGVKLAGTYDYDNEGSPAQRVEVIKDGVLKNFLMSRMPIKNFSISNGHGRNQPGLMPTGRQGNLIVTSTQTVPDSQMRQKLIDEVKKQGKPYGLYFDDIQGGFTITTRQLPQAFQVLPVMVYKVYADGRPDELVRGVDIVGTPLAALTRILTTGDQEHVFNGVCGAESGQVPVAAVAPSMLFSEMEVQQPYFIEYRLNDVEDYNAEAAYGALRENQHGHFRVLRVVVRIGDYKQDSFYARGQGESTILPLDNDAMALRHQIWLATDDAY